MSSLNQMIYKIFTKTYGLTIQSDAIRYINEIFKKENYDNNNIFSVLDTIARFYIQNQGTFYFIYIIKMIINIIHREFKIKLIIFYYI